MDVPYARDFKGAVIMLPVGIVIWGEIRERAGGADDAGPVYFIELVDTLGDV